MSKVSTTVWGLAGLLALVGRPASALSQPYANNQPAVAAVGQSNMASAGSNASAGSLAAGLFSPSSVWTDGSNMAVADTGNNRVLIWNVSGVPTSPNQPADLVLGQLTSGDSSANQGGGPTAVSLSAPTGVYYDSTNLRLYVADRGNNRVLVYNIDLTNNVDGSGNTLVNDVAASEVAGQIDFTHNAGAAGAVALSSPTSISVDATNLYVADSGNNRVLLYTLPIAGPPGPAAATVVGQKNFVSGGPNGAPTGGANGVRGSNRLSFPTGVAADAGGNLYVADQKNNRVLIFTLAGLPAQDANAAFVIGQGSMTAGLANYGRPTPSSTTLSAPSAVYSDNTQLYVTDLANHRVNIYNPIPAANNAAAAIIVGQSGNTAGNPNQGLSRPTEKTLKAPTNAITDGANLYVSDLGNNRVLLYNPTPAAANAAATLPVGQNDLVTGTTHQAVSTPGANGLNRPVAVFADSSRLFVGDLNNNRVVIFNTIPSASGVSADVPVGQPDFTHGAPNQGLGIVVSTGLNGPTGVFSDGAKLYVADQRNSRILVWNAIPAAPLAAPNVVVGQPNFISGVPNNAAAPILGLGAKSLNNPSSVQVCGSSVVIADTFNNRVLIYNLAAFGSQAAAVKVLGQTAFTNRQPNQGVAVSAQTLNFPRSAYCDGAKLYVADSGNNRVLIWNNFGTLAPPPAQNPANVVVGQPGFASGNANNGGRRNATLANPSAVFADGIRLFIADSGNHRVLLYNAIPAANGLAASVAVGQSTFTAGSSNQGGAAAAATLFSPTGVWADSTTGRMFIADVNNNRVLLDLPTVSTPVGFSGGTATLTPASGEPKQAQVQIAQGAFNQNVNVFLSVPPQIPAAAAPAGAVKATGVGVQISLDQNIQPNQPLPVTVTYNPADLAGMDLTKLVLARYDPTNNLWLTLNSFSDPANSKVIGLTDHFSLFQVMQLDTSANSVSTVKVFPNPLLPTEGEPVMNFTSLPPSARVRIYNLAGVLIKDLTASVVGIAQWDGTNRFGVNVASGIYFAAIDAGGRSRTLNIAVQR